MNLYKEKLLPKVGDSVNVQFVAEQTEFTCTADYIRAVIKEIHNDGYLCTLVPNNKDVKTDERFAVYGAYDKLFPDLA